MKRRLPLWLPLLAVACAGSAGPRFPGPGTYDVQLEFAGADREARVTVPPAVASGAPLPVVVAYHGGGGNAEGYRRYAGLDAVADREGFVAVYPDGSGGIGGRLHTWNAGRCCGSAERHDVDDVGFTWALLADLARDLPLDATRVYATGHSNGAMMSYRLAAESADRLAAIAPVAGAMNLEAPFAPAAPVPVMHVHSVDDPRALYGGGLGPPFPLTRRRVQHRAVEAELARWIALDRCPAAAHVTERRRRRVGELEHTAEKRVHAPCASGAEVVLWKLTGAGHGWPGGTGSGVSERIIGPNSDVIDAAEEAWRFFARFSRASAPPLRQELDPATPGSGS